MLQALKRWLSPLSPTHKLNVTVREQRRQIRALENALRATLVRYRGFVMEAPPELCLHVGRVGDAANYWAQGLASSEKVIEAFGERPEGLVLDWGCGVGRTLHWLRDRGTWPQAYRGCDVDPAGIAWLQGQGVAEVALCGDQPPLPYEDASFSGLFSFSVLTHIHPERHGLWFAEIARVLAPGGRAYLTINGDNAEAKANGLTAAERRDYARQGWNYAVRAGHYKSAAFASEPFTRAALEPLLEIESHTPGGYHTMDVWIVRKRAA